MVSKIDELAKRLKEPSYVARFMTTLEVNKLESQFQKVNEPAIFIREVDDLGIIKSVELNPQYAGKVPVPRTQFSAEEWYTLLDRIEGGKKLDGLEIMLIAGELEFKLPFSREDQLQKPPFLFKTYDELGIAIAYRLTPPVTRLPA